MSRRNKPMDNGQEQTATRDRISITDIAQLSTQDITVEIDQGDTVLEIPMRTLTYKEWTQIDREIPNPDPPTTGGPKGPTYDRQAPEYLRGLEEAAQKRMLLRIARSLRIEGLEGQTPEEEIECLQSSMDNNIINALAQVLQQLFLERNARIEARANSFQRPR